MSNFSRINSYFIYGLNALLIFLWFYRDQVHVPTWLQTLGRTHPMILHLPIGFFVMAVTVTLSKNHFRPKHFKRTLNLILKLSAVITVLTALAGIILSRESGYNSETLYRHLNFGLAFSLITAVLASIPVHKKLSRVQYGLVGIGFLALVATGHLGATLTHGDNYLISASSEEEVPEDSITVFEKGVLPVFKNKCSSCHNPNKKKGELVLINQRGILKGGENGIVVNPNDPEKSEILKRIHLTIKDDDHMPPLGKPQLTYSEIKLLELWISHGADFTTLWKSANKNDSLVLLSDQILQAYSKPEKKAYDFDFVPASKIESLNSPFRTVSQISADAPPLKAAYYLSQYFSSNDLMTLKSVSPQLVELSLAGMPVSDNDVNYILEFENLESLNLNDTEVTDQGINKISGLTKLKRISLAGTKITSRSLEYLLNIRGLSEVYVWNTAITNKDIEQIRNENKSIVWNSGHETNEDEILKLTPPILLNQSFLLKPEEAISLKHNLPGTTIRISLDGTEPDSVNAKVYSEPIVVSDHATLKTLATKNGWYKSNTLEYDFYLTGIAPTAVELLTPASKDYNAKGSIGLTDNQLGDADNFRDGNWLGFRENKMEAVFSFEENDAPAKLTLIYNKNIGSYIMPPESIEIWGGSDRSSLKLLTTLNPDQPKKYMQAKIESISFEFGRPFTFLKVIASPVKKLPKWHSGKGEKGWLMVSEIIFR